MINSFIIIAVLWVLFTKILECIPEIDDFILITSLVFFMLVLLIPAFSVAQLEYMTSQSVISLALLQIIVSSLLLVIGHYSSKALTRKVEFVKDDNVSQQNIRNIVWRIIIIPGGVPRNYKYCFVFEPLYSYDISYNYSPLDCCTI